jgi:hypothetical protein
VEDEPPAAGRGVDALVQRTEPDVSIAELVHGLHEIAASLALRVRAELPRSRSK